MSDPLPGGRLRLHYLDGLRGLAALFVVFHHAYFSLTSEVALPRLLARLTYWLFLGRSAVDIFIVLSGYCLMMPLSRSGGDGLRGGMIEFFRRRARRILPPYYAAMALVLIGIALIPALNDASHPESFWNKSLPAFTPGVILSHLLLIQNFDPGWHGRIDYPMWSVATEWQIYFLFPLLLLPLRKWLGTLPAVPVAFFVGLAPLVIDFDRFTGVAPHFLGLFAMGLAAADLNFSARPGLVRWRERLPWGYLAGVFAAGLVGISLLHSNWSLFVAAKDTMVGAATACLLVSCTRHLMRSMEKGSPRDVRLPLALRVMECRVAVGLGAFSYSLYLIHAPVLALCQWAVRSLALSPGLSLFVMLGVAVPLALPCAYLFYLAFEKPFLSPSARAGAHEALSGSGNPEVVITRTAN